MYTHIASHAARSVDNQNIARSFTRTYNFENRIGWGEIGCVNRLVVDTREIRVITYNRPDTLRIAHNVVLVWCLLVVADSFVIAKFHYLSVMEV